MNDDKLTRWVRTWPDAVRDEIECWLWGMFGHGGRLSKRAQCYWLRLLARLK